MVVAQKTRAVAIALLASAAVACAHYPPTTTTSPRKAPIVRNDPGAGAENDSTTTAATPPTSRFYAGRPYGSESQFNPLSVIVNEGWDMFRLVDDRDLFGSPYRPAWRSLWGSIKNPGGVIKRYGVSRWLQNEVFPLSLKGAGGAQWEPNYHLHLFGAGMTYIRTAEWFDRHDVPHPRLAAAATLYAGHIANEIVENIGHTGDDEDGLTDLLIFDPAGMLLWNTEWMQRTFSGRVEMTDWYGQPVLRPDNNRLENAYSMFMLRAPLPKTTSWKVITTGGNAFLLGLSRRVGTDLWVSATGGVIPFSNPVLDPVTGRKTVDVKPNVGFFVDRDGSLLASFVGLSGQTNGPTLNVYPGVFAGGILSPGFFVQQATGGVDGRGVRFGITSRLGVGLGAMARRP